MRTVTLCYTIYTIKILKHQRHILRMLDRISSIFEKKPTKMKNKRLYLTVDILKTIILREFLMCVIDKTRRFKSDNTYVTFPL